MKTNGPKTRLPKATKCSNSVQEDIEIEIAEALYGLMKQSQRSKDEDSAGNPLSKLKSEDSNGFSTDTKAFFSPQIASSAQSQSQTTVLPDPLVGIASKKKKVEAEDSPTPVKVENVQRAKMEICSPKQSQTSGLNEFISDFNLDKDAFKMVPVLLDSRENVVMIKHGDSQPSIEEPNFVDGAVTKENSVWTEKESAKVDVDFQDSTVTKAISTVSKVEIQREEKFKIDLMVPPPMASSPERDSPVDIAQDPVHKVLDTESKIETLAEDEVKVVKEEMRAEDGKDKRMDTIREKRDSLNLDLEKPQQDSGSDCCKFEQHGQKQQLSKVGIPKVEKTAQSSSVPVPINLACWPNGLPPLGYMPPFQTSAPIDGSIRSSTALQPPHFLLSQPRPRRCAMHHYIARNIHLHQQFTKMNYFWPAAPGSASLCVANPNNLDLVPSAENLILGNPFQRSFQVVNLNPTEEKGEVAEIFPGLPNRKDKSSDCTNFMDTAQRKASQPALAGNLMHGPAFIFPLSQHQITANESGPSKSATSSDKASLINNSTPGISTSSTALPGVAAAVSFNYPNLGANEAPCLTILQNNGYPFAISAPVGKPLASREGTPTQAVPFFNGSLYSSQMFHPQLQQQAHSQPLVQPAYQNAVTSSGSSSSHKQLESQALRRAQVSGNNFLSSTNIHLQQLQKYHVLPSDQSRKMEPEMNGENTTANNQKSVYGQNPALPDQPLNFALLPSATLRGGSVNGNHSEKQLSQQKNFKGGVDLVPPQAFAMSFASFAGRNIVSNLNFSSMAQNPTNFHSRPDIAWQGYQVASVPQAAQKKNHQISDGKNGAGSTNLDDGKKVSSGKSDATNGHTYVLDNSDRTSNFVSSPVTGNWPPRSVTSTKVTINSPIGASSPNSQQQLLQLQRQHMVQHQQQPATASRSKTPTTNTMPASFIASKFSSNATQSIPWKYSTRTQASQATNVAGGKNFPQQLSRSPQGQTQISFGVNIKSGLLPQGQEIPTNRQSVSSMIVRSPPSCGNLRTSSTGSKIGTSVPTLQSQQSENSSAGNGQKSSPVCGRNVPSILSTCPSHLSEPSIEI
ncbi:protein TIME FOR COFFEE-like [Durio zibethinus]|uniref:Protein TIME FOR COFFEE-like n=1 Tax=Durio zibethinus TaxID=66656 RepID=A0A6P5XH12_DURZI|nr:protein TIME FOR COFFEE-like [Durio zibethinus]